MYLYAWKKITYAYYSSCSLCQSLVDCGTNSITQRALKVTVFKTFKLDTIRTMSPVQGSKLNMEVWPPGHEVASSKVWPPVTTGNPLSLQVSLALLLCLHNKHGLAFKHLSSSWYSVSILLASLHNTVWLSNTGLHLSYSMSIVLVSLHNKHLSSLVILYEYSVGQPAQQTLVFTCHTLWV